MVLYLLMDSLRVEGKESECPLRESGGERNPCRWQEFAVNKVCELLQMLHMGCFLFLRGHSLPFEVAFSQRVWIFMCLDWLDLCPVGTSRSFLGGKVSKKVRAVNGTWNQSFTFLHVVMLLLLQQLHTLYIILQQQFDMWQYLRNIHIDTEHLWFLLCRFEKCCKRALWSCELWWDSQESWFLYWEDHVYETQWASLQGHDTDSSERKDSTY